MGLEPISPWGLYQCNFTGIERGVDFAGIVTKEKNDKKDKNVMLLNNVVFIGIRFLLLTLPAFAHFPSK